MIEFVTNNDMHSWLELAKEVEPLFGPMVEDRGFQDGLKAVIAEKRAYCIRENSKILYGVIVISKTKNEIEWFAVATKARRKGYGELLLRYAVDHLDAMRPIMVQTFDKTVSDGIGARKLYLKMGFRDFEKAGLNPAGIPTVILKRDVS
jgi:GNAT superfamily N-acetyltransferase